MVRASSVAGQFYNGNAEALRKQIADCFRSPLGPGGLPESATDRIIKGAVSPHAGYMFSGPAAAHVYKAIAESQKPDLFLLIGPNHTGMGRTATLIEDFETPLGNARVDSDFGNDLINKGVLIESKTPHTYEHSLEVQLPFLQYTYQNNFRFLPIVVSSPLGLERIAGGLKKAIDRSGKKVCIIASSDFTHFGPNYGYVPFTEKIKENIKKLDTGAIGKIISKDIEGFEQYIRETGATVCGFLPIALLMRTVEYSKCELLKYYTSADIAGDYQNSVSYAGIIFE